MAGLDAETVQTRFNLQFLQDEELIAAYGRHWVLLVRRIIGLVVLLLVGLIISIRLIAAGELPLYLPLGLFVVLGILLAYFYIDWRDDALILTNQRAIHVERTVWLFLGQQEMPLSNIQNVHFSVQGLAGRLMNYGEVTIETAARGTEIAFGPVHDPRQVEGEIMSRVQQIRTRTSRELMEKTFLHRLDQKQFAAPKIPGLEEEAPAVRSRRFLLLPSNPRVQGNRVTWYKHYIFLFRRLFWSLLMLTLLAIAAFFLPQVQASAEVWVIWGVLLLVALFTLVVNYQLWVGDIYEVTDTTIVDATRTPFGLFGESRRTADLGRIQNITFRRPGFLANLLNFGNVRIQTAGIEDFTFDRVPRPADVQQEIYRRRERYRLLQEQQQREQLAEWLVTYHRMSQKRNWEIEEE